MKRWQMLLGLVALCALVIYALRGPIAMRLMGVALPRMMAADPIGDLPDGLHLTLCGAGSPLPDPKRSGPCVGIVAGGKLFVVDAGSAAARNLNAFGLPAGQVEAVFLTHFHSDHIDGLGELALQRWAGGAPPNPCRSSGPMASKILPRGSIRPIRRIFATGSHTMENPSWCPVRRVSPQGPLPPPSRAARRWSGTETA